MRFDGLRTPWLALGAAVLICCGFWRWAEVVLVPSNTAYAVNKKIPIGNNSDLYPRWLGTRELLLHHRDPYSVEVTREIQTGFYGRPLDSNNPSDPIGEEGFTYPLYAVFLLAPISVLPFHTAQTVFRWLLLLLTACSLPLWMYAMGIRARFAVVVAGMILVLSTSAAISEYHQQNLAGLVIFLLAGAAAAAARGWLLLGGLLLALATIKPEISWLVILWFMFWAAARWSERQWLVFGFVGAMLALFAAAAFLLPPWLVEFLGAVRRYPAHGGDLNLVQVLLPPWLADPLTATLIGLCVFLCWKWRGNVTKSGWGLVWTATVTLVVVPKLAAYNHPLLIPGLLILLASHKEIFRSGLLPRALVKAAFACPVWQWGAALILSLVAFFVPADHLRRVAGVPEFTLLALPPLTLLAVAASTFATRSHVPAPANASETLAGQRE